MILLICQNGQSGQVDQSWQGSLVWCGYDLMSESIGFDGSCDDSHRIYAYIHVHIYWRKCELSHTEGESSAVFCLGRIRNKIISSRAFAIACQKLKIFIK